ncbi:MAG: peptidoglycan editing factor PgeF [Devosia sp.]|uniref:peptidoglycan editing factor PgeF n=1 Tax=Devosia sp. TaxID=1871048 RepID=UPI0024CBFE05|nr:peptidoglycan editing factor PgeF [Devosia sp.]UYO01025.1 MAG: peptidoglycan editing factor PgeF [Devosia sp.]
MTGFETSPLLSTDPSIRHGFFGRSGGVSEGDFAGLNVSWSVGDDPDIVDKNRTLVRNAIGAGPLVIVRQTHSTDVATVTGPIEPSSIEADALVTATPGLALAILTADCTPILFHDPEAGVIGAAHAGWRGAVDGIVGRTVAAMADLGADPARIRAAIGPTISAPNYEVGPQFMRDFLALHPDGGRYFHVPAGRKEHFDLPGFVRDQLASAGITRIDPLAICTYARPDRYFSHRYATHQGTRTGRQVSVIALT